MAVTICRLLDKEGEEELKRIYKEFYIEKGIAYSDPWLTSLGHWVSGNYIESLNSIAEILSREEPIITNDMDPQWNLFYNEDKRRMRKMSDEWLFESPLLSTFNASMIILFRKLEKHYLV